jgi:RecB family endonuclease NucS
MGGQLTGSACGGSCLTQYAKGIKDYVQPGNWSPTHAPSGPFKHWYLSLRFTPQDSKMALFKVTQDRLESVQRTTFSNEGILERQDLQRLLLADISPLRSDLLVIAEEFGEWENSKRRIDLLCIDRQARLVIVEIKRTDDGGHMELQAIRYAAMVSSMTLDQAINAYSKRFIGDKPQEMASKNLLAFLGVESFEEIEFDAHAKIILVAANFSTEITTSVMWLNKYDLDITCIRMKPYNVDGQVLVDLTQIIPLPEAAEYEVKIRAQEQEAKKVKSARQDILMKFWGQLIERSMPTTRLLAGRNTTTDAWLSTGIGRTGFALTLSLSRYRARIECYIKFGNDDARSEAAFNALKLNREKIEKDFEGVLDWQDLPERLGCRICTDLDGGWQTAEEGWPVLQQSMIEKLAKLERALREPILALTI